MVNVDDKLVDELATLEINALINALKDPELRKNPQILARARSFLKDNRLIANPGLPLAGKVKEAVLEVPDFDMECEENFN